jgi:hypothetical protein
VSADYYAAVEGSIDMTFKGRVVGAEASESGGGREDYDSMDFVTDSRKTGAPLPRPTTGR